MRLASLVVTALTATALCGCAPSPVIVVQRAGGSTMVAPATQPEVVMAAAIPGTLTRTDRGCLGLELEPGNVVVLTFPFESTLAGDGAGVTVPEVGLVRLGDEVVANGFRPLDHPDVPAECRSATAAAIWQQ